MLRDADRGSDVTAVGRATEYKTLRDELIAHYHRIFIILGAEMAAFAAGMYATIGESDAGTKVFLRVLINVLLAAGIGLTFLVYCEAYKIGSYIIVYLENEAARFHVRSRHMNLSYSSHPLNAPLSWFDRRTEDDGIATVYLVMILAVAINAGVDAAALDGAFLPAVGSKANQWQFGTSFAALLVWLRLPTVYRKSSRQWTTRWLTYKSGGYEATAEADLGLDRRSGNIAS